MIFDTSFIIDVMRNDGKAVARLKELIKKGEPQMIAAPSIFELYSGLARSKKPPKEKKRILDILGGQLIAHLDDDAARLAGEVDGTLIKEGKMIGPIDSMIAGIALIRKQAVLTRNVKDFSRVKGLHVETY